MISDNFSQSVTDVIRRRTSRRLYAETPVDLFLKKQVDALLSTVDRGPFGSKLRFRMLSSTARGNKSLNQLATYGFIRQPAAYVVGAVENGAHDLEDFGYVLEQIVLKLTEMGLDTCWVGATFDVNAFSGTIKATSEEITPAVISVGYATVQQGRFEQLVQGVVSARKRLPWEKLFFNGDCATPLNIEGAGRFATALEMVRLGPSASNRQPWRIVMQDGSCWHLYLQRTRCYLRSLKAFNRADIQRIDMGIAMSHFALTCEEEGCNGRWSVDPPETGGADDAWEYVATFHVEK